MKYISTLLVPYAEVSVDPKVLADVMTLKICEVEEIKTRSLPKDLVIWFVKETSAHPNADKLTVCQVDCWKVWEFQICCWAENVRAWIYVAVAIPWCHLPAIDLTIEPRELRWEASNGMICSKTELGIAQDQEHKWIWVLQLWENPATSAKWELETSWDMQDITMDDIWVSLSTKYPWLESYIFDIENKTITHRPEMFGHFWLAVDLHAINTIAEQPIRTTPWFEELFAYGKTWNVLDRISWETKHDIDVTVESKNVLTYCTLLLKDITREESTLERSLQMEDLWLQARSNRVDYSNIYMYETGQPVHFFDADKISWGLIIRQAKKDERFVDLFDKEHILTEDDIVIADHEKICALWGIIWSNTSWIDENTKNILAEVANFDPIQVRRTGTRLWLRTDAELRFEKTINPLRSLICFKQLLSNLQDVWFDFSYAWISSMIASDSVWTLTTLDINIDEISTMLWYDASEIWTDILERLWYNIEGQSIAVPAWVSPDDIHTQACLVEEIARIHGFENITSTSYLDASEYVPFSPSVSQNRALEELMIDRLGFDQCETYPWLHTKMSILLGKDPEHHVSMENALHDDWKLLRTDMLWAFLEVVEKNAPFSDTMNLFDIWKVWTSHDGSKESSLLVFAQYKKAKIASLDSLFLSSKWIIQEILEQSKVKWKLMFVASSQSYAHPKQQADISLNGKIIGNIQTIHPSILAELKIPEQASLVITQLNITLLLEISESQKKWSRGMSSYETLQDQILFRDLNFVLDAGMEFGLVTSAILKIKEVKDLEIFDIYTWENLPENKKSLAVTLKIIGDEELQTEHINAIMDKAIANVKEVGGELR